MKRYLLLVLCIGVLVSGCGSAPSVRSSMLVDGYTEKLKNMQFVYRESNLNSTATSSRGYSFDGNMNGYDEFGDILVDVASSEFNKYGVTVTDSFKIEAEEKPVLSKNTLLIYSAGGRVKQDRASTTVSFTFYAKYISSAKKKILWNGLIETETWAGRNFLSKAIPPTLYDEKYARELLSKIADKMKKDGLIQ